MAVDTATRRFSMMGFGDTIDQYVVPSGAVGAAARATFLDLYSGIALEAVVTIIATTETVVLAMIDNVTNALSTAIDSNENVVSAAIELNTVFLSIIDTVENAFDTPIDDDENVLDGT